MEIKLKGREMPRDAAGSVRFTVNADSQYDPLNNVLRVFSPEEVVELVNRAIYQLEYQRDAHRKRGAAARALVKEAEAALAKAGVDVDAERTKRELKGEK